MTDLVVPEGLVAREAARDHGHPRWLLAFSFWLLLYRRTWRGSILSTFVYPTLYLASIGIGLGGLVNRHVGAHALSLGGVSYLRFVAPGILAASAMQIGINEASWPVMSAIRWQRSYLAQCATPLRVIDVFVGHLAWIALRLLFTCAVFVAISAGFGAVTSPFSLVEIIAATLLGLAFATPMAALAAALQGDEAFSTINRLVIVPLFLFSGSFFPIAQLPPQLRLLAELTPLYHGVALCRSLAGGQLLLWSNLVHLVYLLVLAILGVALGRRTYSRRLER
ncbi:MAG TPA: ABC transporter permease [Acidimicrobiales bacterium]|nr:ABC transporter permease [Acidimicrobiales bacterium]